MQWSRRSSPPLNITASADALGWHFVVQHKGRWPLKKPTTVPLAQWDAESRHHAGISLLLRLLSTEQATPSAEGVSLTHAHAATLSVHEASAMGLPPTAPFSIHLSRNAPISDPVFAVTVQWFNRNGRPVLYPKRIGSCLKNEDETWLILDPLHALLESVAALNLLQGGDRLDARMVAYSRFREQLIRITGDVRVDDYLNGLIIHHATGLGIDLESGIDQPMLPTLHATRSRDPVSREVEEQEPEYEPLLPRHYANQMNERFLTQGGRSAYTLGNGVYAVLDAPVAAAVRELARINQSDAPTRERFRADPLAFLLPAIEEAGGDAGLLCDLRGYGARVIGMGAWVKAQLSFKLPVTKQWFPEEAEERFTVSLPDGGSVALRKSEVVDLLAQVTSARAHGIESLEFGGQTLPVDAALEATLQGIYTYAQPNSAADPGTATTAEPELDPRRVTAPATYTVAQVYENLENLAFRAQTRDPSSRLDQTLPSGLRTSPKPHQIEGILWLQSGYRSGAPGLLLADDMGLGKTYQVLVFLYWLRRSGLVLRGRPFLIVAPKTLLGNWEEEVALHLGEGALGRPLLLFGKRLQEVKRQAGSGRDIMVGHPTLDIACMEEADWILTTYETLRDYHPSFAKIRFSVAVYDEAQKLKNPTSLMSCGAKAQQAEFTLLMTGTPIENSVIDLWALLDIAWPGFIQLSAREFLYRYQGEGSEARQELRSRLVKPGDDRPAILLRRFKSDILESLPPREVVRRAMPMPPVQIEAYNAVLKRVKTEALPAIAGLQALRGVSLHPHLAQPPRSPDQDAAYIAASARFTTLFMILDEIYAFKEKALIFIELREAQSVLYELIQRRYRLPSPQPEVINGSTAGPARDRIRRGFQARIGFDVLLLGPKAAGFGLTLTAANHVIHLSRWWNPAVEDQCSDRVYRMGQTRPVTIHLPLAVHSELGEHSFDYLLDGLLEEKRALSREIVVPVHFSSDDLSRLFDGVLGKASEEGERGLLQRIDNMDWQTFENWVAGEVQKAGWRVKMTSPGPDGGADIVAEYPGQHGHCIVQCKHRSQGYEGRVDESVMDELLRARQAYGSGADDRLVVVTNGRLNLAAESAARMHGITSYDREHLYALPQRFASFSRHPPPG